MLHQSRQSLVIVIPTRRYSVWESASHVFSDSFTEMVELLTAASEEKTELIESSTEEPAVPVSTQKLSAKWPYPAVVIDSGSRVTKVGFAGDSFPTHTFPTLCGKLKYPGTALGAVNPDSSCVGNEALRQRGILTLRHPVERGVVTDWDLMEKIWHHAFYNRLRVLPHEQPVLLTEVAVNPKASRERMIQLVFDTFQVPSAFVSIQANLSLLSANLGATGLVVECGAEVTEIVPVFEGYAMMGQVRHTDFGGYDLDDVLGRMLCERGYSCQELVENIKESLCYVTWDFDSEMKQSEPEATFEMPDGHMITLGNERFRCPEVLFQPELAGDAAPGLPQIIRDCVLGCDEDFRAELLGNVVLSGGSMLFKGMKERMKAEMQRVLAFSVNVSVAPEHAAWRGGAILAAREDFQHMWVTRADYEQGGPEVVHEKCF